MATNKTAEVIGAELAQTVSGDVLMALSPNAELVVFKPSDEAFEEITKIKVSETPIYAYPVVSANRVFVKDQETVALYVIE